MTRLSKLYNMNIDEMVDFAKFKPKEFDTESELFQKQNIVDLCKNKDNSGQCEWRLNGILLRLTQENNQYKDPIARLNHVVARFYQFIETNYGKPQTKGEQS